MTQQIDYNSEIERIKKEIEELTNEESKKNELGNLQKKLELLKFRKKNAGILKFTRGWEKGMKNTFKGIGTIIKSTGKALEKSDDFIAKQKIKETEQKKQIKELNKDKTKRKSLADEIKDLGVD